jgi:DNA repair protein RecN (Recombination protein N)
MLQHLRIENYALIDALDLEFRPGFNLLSGETGSGKSIVVDALELLLGEKASSEVIRSGAERARITGVFAPSESSSHGEGGQWSRLAEILSESGIEIPDGPGSEDLVLQRDILPGGKSRVFINHQPATVGLAKAIAPYLAEVHGQNEQQELFSPSAQLEMLDRFGGLSTLAAQTRERFGRWKELCAKQDDLARRREERLRQMDLWQFQKREIEDAGITPGADIREDQQLEEEKLRLAHAARIEARLAACYDLLYDSTGSSVASLASAQRSLEEVSPYDARLQPFAEALLAAKVSIEDVALAVRDHLSRLDASPGRLEEVENRLALLDRLKRKYGPTLEDVLRHGDEASAHLREAESDEEVGRTIEREVREAAAAFETVACELARRRARAAKELRRAVEGELQELAMQGTVFEARLTAPSDPQDSGAWSASGMDRVEFQISPNPGEPLRPLARIASGGELSRIMLALETVTDARQSQAAAGTAVSRAGTSRKQADRSEGIEGQSGRTLVFDEVDSGIGGRAAETVGRKLRELGASRQVLCVTHLPQIASFAHHHFRVEKIEQNGRTVTRVEYLEGRERVAELARMLSGSQVTDAVLKHATELLKINS